MRAGMEATDLRLPDIPLAKEEDIDSNKNSQHNDSDENVGLEEESRLNDDFSGSLEDLVGNFDERIVSCFKNHSVDTEELAPVQIRTQEEIMQESQTWYTLTGNYGNMQPLDFNKSAIQRAMLPALNLKQRKTSEDGGVELSDNEDDLRSQMDMHQLISQGSVGDSPPQTADQVIEEIDEMLQSCDLTGSMMTDRTMESVDSMYSSMRSPCDPRQHIALQTIDNLQELSYSKLVSLQAEMEQLIQVYNQSLVEELAHKDELEFEKETKNTFISLLLSIQNKRRQFSNERKRKGLKLELAQLPQYMTATIPYNDGQHIDSQSLQALNKILRAINEDNSSVPSLLTDYILTVVCPKSVSC